MAGLEPSLPACGRRDVKECHSLKPGMASSLCHPEAPQFLGFWFPGSEGAGQQSNFYPCDSHGAALWLLLKCP